MSMVIRSAYAGLTANERPKPTPTGPVKGAAAGGTKSNGAAISYTTTSTEESGATVSVSPPWVEPNRATTVTAPGG